MAIFSLLCLNVCRLTRQANMENDWLVWGGEATVSEGAHVSWISRVPFSISISCSKWGLGWFSGISAP